MKTLRFAQIALLAAVVFFLLLVVFNNLTDYGSNLKFVEHVLTMDSTVPGNAGLWRALNQSWEHRAFYFVIIFWEALTALIMAIGVWRMWQTRQAPRMAWALAKSLGTLGLTLSMLQWSVAFLSVGGEWFLMWQSRVWNGQEAAFRNFAIMGIILIILHLRDPDETGG